MKILLIHNRYRQKGGEDTVFENECKLLKENGVDVDTVVFDNRDIKGILKRIEMGIFAPYNPFSKRIIEGKIEEFKPDMVHVHNFFPQISPSIFWKAKAHKIPVVLTLHNYRLICPNGLLLRDGKVCKYCIKKKFPYNSLFKRCYRGSFFQTIPVFLMLSLNNLLKTWEKTVSGFIFLTEFQKKVFFESHIKFDKNKVFIKPNFVPDPGNGEGKRDDFFLYSGRLSEEKGIQTLLSAHRKGNFKLFVAGDGPMRDLVVDYERKSKNFKYLGFLGKNELYSYMKRSKALIFPSICYENFPISIVEAFSTGTPVIASKIGAQSEIVKDGENGFLFSSDNPDSLLEKIEVFSSGDQSELYFRARETYLKNYTREKNFHTLFSIYEKILTDAP